MRARYLAWTVIGLVCAVACSGSHARNDADIESVDDWAHVLVAEHCRQLFLCPLPIEGDLKSTFLWGDEAHCIAAQERAIEGGSLMTSYGPLSSLRWLEAEGLIHIDPQRAQACRAATMDCWVIGSEAGACDHVIEGVAPMGGACDLSVECEGDAYCAFEGDCPGMCMPRKSVDEVCESWNECTSEEPTDCLRIGNALEARCTVVESGTASGEGERCTIGGASFIACPPGLWCNVIAPDVYSGTCQQPLADLEPCSSSDDVCEEGALCLGREGDMQCRKAKPITAEESVDARGESRECGISDQGRYCDLFNGWRCVDGVCVPFDNAAGSLGAPCLVSGAGVEIGICNPGLYCDRHTGVCSRRLAAGASCRTDLACESLNCEEDGSNASSTCVEKFCEVTR